MSETPHICPGFKENQRFYVKFIVFWFQEVRIRSKKFRIKTHSNVADCFATLLEPNIKYTPPPPQSLSILKDMKMIFISSSFEVHYMSLRRIRINIFISMRIRIQGAKTIRIHADPGQTLPSLKVEVLPEKYTL
jgi:hypothetical protein